MPLHQAFWPLLRNDLPEKELQLLFDALGIKALLGEHQLATGDGEMSNSWQCCPSCSTLYQLSCRTMYCRFRGSCLLDFLEQDRTNACLHIPHPEWNDQRSDKCKDWNTLRITLSMSPRGILMNTSLLNNQFCPQLPYFLKCSPRFSKHGFRLAGWRWDSSRCFDCCGRKLAAASQGEKCYSRLRYLVRRILLVLS